MTNFDPTTNRRGKPALSQAAIAAAMIGAVKPLKWVEGNIDSNGKKGDTYYAKSMVDFSPIAVHKHPRGWWLNKNSITYRTIELAKAAAQKIETARILSALSIPTDATAALESVKAQVRDEALNECLVLSMEHDLRYGEGLESDLTTKIRAMKGEQHDQL